MHTCEHMARIPDPSSPHQAEAANLRMSLKTGSKFCGMAMSGSPSSQPSSSDQTALKAAMGDNGMDDENFEGANLLERSNPSLLNSASPAVVGSSGFHWIAAANKDGPFEALPSTEAPKPAFAGIVRSRSGLGQSLLDSSH